MAPSFSPPIHPGEILREEYLNPLGLKPYTLAKHLRVPRTRIERLVSEQTAVTPIPRCGWRVSSARRRNSG